jgi:23S rRNA pseudouridine1911/1915/1917 synthase
MTNKIRLHKYVTDYLKRQNSDFTSSDIQKNIQKLGVSINNELFTNRLEWIYMGERIDISHWPLRDHGPFEEIKVLLYNSDFLLVYKPKGIVTESGAGHIEQNLVSFLQATYGKKTEIFLPVHRLDKDTMGLILIARNEIAHIKLQDEFRERNVAKKYLTVLEGKLEYPIEIKAWQSRNTNNPLKQIFFWAEDKAKKYSELARETESKFTPLNYCPELNQTLVEVELKTGRMHQIRLQAESIGLPIRNEKLYNTKVSIKQIEQAKKIETKIELTNLNKVEFEKKLESIFSNSGSYLLCNYLEIEDTNDGILSYQLKKY